MPTTMRTILGLLFSLTSAAVISCNAISDPQQAALPEALESFVVRGEFTIVENDGPCPVFFADNEVIYHLFQDPALPNEEFDRVTRSGVIARLEVFPRPDIAMDCRIGTVVEVLRVLEVDDSSAR